jgi:hypothetical protein
MTSLEDLVNEDFSLTLTSFASSNKSRIKVAFLVLSPRL